MAKTLTSPNHFIKSIARNDLKNGKHSIVHTRFPPEPNGYLHLGHAKSICLNFGLAEELEGKCNLRFDDTNPEKESEEFMRSIKDSVEWLGFKWDTLRYASDYFPQLYDYAIELIEKGLAYVDDLPPDQIRDYRGTLTEAGIDSPSRDRPVEENIELFTRMRAGEFEEGSYALRAKIDMASPNIVMRDPILYRIRYATHYRAGDEWCIYPMYDFTHCISDAIEGITHSLCTLEFQDNRELYDWILDNVSINRNADGELEKTLPRQIEFGRSNLEYSISSKRKLTQLVQSAHVNGWDDPRLTTLAGLRRRGVGAAAIRQYCNEIGVTKKDSVIDMSVLENAIRAELDPIAERRFAVLDPILMIINNYKADAETIDVKNHPNNETMGRRSVEFGKRIYIERNDFMLKPPEGYFRLSPGSEVRLRFAYAVTCEDVVVDENGQIAEIHCRYDPQSAHGKTADGRKIKGIIHWVNADTAVEAEVRLYDRLFKEVNPGAFEDITESLNENSLTVFDQAKLEPALATAAIDERFQFERLGYFCRDLGAENAERLVFNRVVSLRDTWGKKQKR